MRIRNKNMQKIGRWQMIYYSIKQALASQHVDRVIVNTDSAAIARFSRKHGAMIPFLRNARLAQSQTTSSEVVLDTIKRYEAQRITYDIIVWLQPTSPLRTAEDIDLALELLVREKADSVVSVRAPAENTGFFKRVQSNGIVVESSPFRPLRPSASGIYKLNGAIFIARWNEMKKQKTLIGKNCIAFPMPEERSVDIDTPFDLLIARALQDNKNECS